MSFIGVAVIHIGYTNYKRTIRSFESFFRYLAHQFEKHRSEQNAINVSGAPLRIALTAPAKRLRALIGRSDFQLQPRKYILC